jgi:MobA/MobL family
MAIYSFNHDSFGKTTNRAGAAGDNAAYNARENETRLEHGRQDGTAAGNAAYNAREEATYAVGSHVIPPEPKQAEAWFREQEKGERKNARMSDRFIGALPRELTQEQCIAAVEKFCREVTQDRIPWHFALHLELDKKNDPDWNPHAHIIFRDRHIETGKRFLHTSAGPKERAQFDKKGIQYWTTKDFRAAWEAQMNRALHRAGHDIRIDHRSLKKQGIGRAPQIHIGPGSQKAAAKGHRFQSHDRQHGGRIIQYCLFDRGTRSQHNMRIGVHNAAYEATGHRPAHQRRAGTLKAKFAERINASPMLKQRIGSQKRNVQVRTVPTNAVTQQQQQGKSRRGGERGR